MTGVTTRLLNREGAFSTSGQATEEEYDGATQNSGLRQLYISHLYYVQANIPDMYRRHLLIGLWSSLAILTGCVGGTEESPGAGSSEADTPEEDDSPECADTVTIESGGMAPALSKGDEVCIVEYNSYEPVDNTEETGVIPADVGEEIGYEKLGGTRKDGYEAADISETAAINIDEAWNSLKPRERTRLMQYLSTRYEELAEHDGGENPE